MAATMELRCWGGDWGLPSVHTESLIVLAYAKFSGATITVTPIDWTWKTLTGTVPELVYQGSTITEPAQILNFLRKQQRFNADYELSARQGADTMAYIALLEEKLRPALLHTFWVDAENYANLTRPWFASRSPFPLNFLVPGRHANTALSRILLTKGESPLHTITEVEGKIYSEAKECLNLLSHRLGTAYYFFGNTPCSLDAFVFGFVAPLHKASLPSSPLQSHLRQLDNLQRFCDHILNAHFSSHPGSPQPVQETVDANLQKLTQLVNKESNLIEKMDDNLRSSPQHKPLRADPRPSLGNDKSSTPA
ncbi:metaxin-3 isoform X1 [Salvelinus fontinalis]|uniref:Metaxin n=2 Tax=Salmoninae TaxID=504568 RepID=A0A8U0PVI7_SALNM|nr:metaxin-3 isoform X1 [Salmo salar]XP_029572684.1 metaxin-3 isoform X1 [Salmo trutta]XP_038831608.1 metaxin-3 isoform X1 [Salvelinus namaycush]XP_055775983.1 metaxin-3 isoform X1 [Salvelinus fontinalis]|eukprot:XP_014026237.1 PREDICTED: metaxin-3 isoform X1 [Salmo salar]